MSSKKTTQKYKHDGTVFFDLSNDVRFFNLVVTIYREHTRLQIEENHLHQKGEQQMYSPTFGDNLYFLSILKEANPKVFNQAREHFIEGLKNKEKPKHYGKHCKKCAHNIKVYYGKKENPCHRCGEVN